MLNLINPSHEDINATATNSEAEKEDRSTVEIAGSKRHSMVGGSKTLSKKLKHINDTLDEEIERHKKGMLFLLMHVFCCMA